jgi:C4-dicarboxylate-specific signal transduction histidine kinase
MAVFFILQRRRDVESLRRAHGELELRVQDRTAELAKVNQALVAEITERMETEQ